MDIHLVLGSINLVGLLGILYGIGKWHGMTSEKVKNLEGKIKACEENHDHLVGTNAQVEIIRAEVFRHEKALDRLMK